MRRLPRPAQRLRRTIDCMPLETRRAMLSAIEANAIIVGAYTDGEGGVCPMLAAHRNGGRTSFASFATAWDRYTRGGKGARPATERELRTLRAMLEASIAAEAERNSGDLAEAIRQHRASSDAAAACGRAREAQIDSGERDRSAELSGRPGWAWSRPFRSLDEYERALGQLGASERPARDEQTAHALR